MRIFLNECCGKMQKTRLTHHHKHSPETDQRIKRILQGEMYNFGWKVFVVIFGHYFNFSFYEEFTYLYLILKEKN